MIPSIFRDHFNDYVVARRDILYSPNESVLTIGRQTSAVSTTSESSPLRC